MTKLSVPQALDQLDPLHMIEPVATAPKSEAMDEVSRVLLHLPVAIGAMLLAVLRIGRARHSFLPTPHAEPPGERR